MNLETRGQILELRGTGLGYTKIAKQVGVTRDAVRYVCKVEGVAGVITGKRCTNCGKELTQPEGKGRRRKFCTEACRRAWWLKHPEKGKKLALYTTTCAYCKKEFTSYGNDHRIYCSRDCYVKARFWT